MHDAVPPPPPPQEPYDAQGALLVDLPCRKCGYNLRGLTASGLCPECGTAVGRSLAGDLLQFSDPDYLQTLRGGAQLLLLSLIFIFVFACIAGIASGSGGGQADALSIVTGLGSGLLAFVAAWLITTPDPSGLGEDAYGRERKIVRVTLLIGLASHLPSLILELPLRQEILITLWIIVSLVGLVNLVGHWFLLIYLARLATRIPDNKLVSGAHMVRWTFVIGTGMGMILGAIAYPLMRYNPDPPMTWLVVLGFLGTAAGLLLFISTILYLVLLFHLIHRLREQVEFAQQRNL